MVERRGGGVGIEEGGDVTDRKGMSWQRGRGCLGREEGGVLAERKGVTWQR